MAAKSSKYIVVPDNIIMDSSESSDNNTNIIKKVLSNLQLRAKIGIQAKLESQKTAQRENFSKNITPYSCG